ncbi:MAG: GHKL domain-containing protein [Nitrospirae bacterium]|nr:GHKL domain-containing protein [Nitrospirota bacterium]
MKAEFFRSADFLQNLFDAVPSFLFIVDSDVRIHHLNSSALKLLNKDREAILLKRGGEVLNCLYSHEVPEGCGRSAHCKECVIRNSVTEVFKGKNVFRKTTKVKHLADTGIQEVYLSITASAFPYRDSTYALLVLEDVTREKRFEEELRLHAAQLEASYKDMESFSYTASHDLKTPLRIIEGFSHILLTDYSDKLDDNGRGLLNSIRGNTKKMSQLIDDLLEFSRVSTREIQRTEINMESLIKSIFEDMKQAAWGRSMHLKIGALPPAYGDMSMVRQVLVNLLSNAVKFTSTRKTTVITAAGRTENNENIYYVQDNGVGFDMKYCHKLFDSFQRIHEPSKYEGTGIGLAIVRRVVEKHGGRVWAEGKPDEGASFYFTLPKK